MEIQFTWKTRLFSNRFEVFSNDTPAGELKKEGWSRKVVGELNNRKIMFETKGFFKQQTNIIDLIDGSVLGQVKFHSWKSQSSVIFRNTEYQWQFDNFFRSKWSLSSENGVLIKYESHGFKGEITSYVNDEVLILAGFFIRNFLKQKTAEIAAAT
jgi:hypothetical protein